MQYNCHMYLIIGLGNPEKEYINTRHNLGRTLLENIAENLNKDFIKSRLFKYFDASANKVDFIGLVPLTFVNESGKAVKQAISDYPKSQLIVIHDDLDRPFGSIRIKKGGSSGGHNGIQSIISSLGINDFWRLKIGIGRPPGRKDPSDFVLEEFKRQEQKELPFVIENSKEALFGLIEHGPEWAMNKYH